MLGISQSARAQQNYTFQYHFVEGDHFSLHQKIHQETYLTLEGISHRTTEQFNATLLFSLKSLQPGQQATFKVVYQKILLDISGDNQQMTVNTSLDGNDVFNILFKKIIDQPFTINLTSNGSITLDYGLDHLFSQMLNSLPDHKKKDLQALKTLLTQNFSKSTLQSDLQEVLPHYTDQSVSTGNSWTHRVSLSGTLNGWVDQTWSLEYGDPGSSQLTLQGKLSTDQGKIISMGDQLMGSVDLTGNVQGNYLIDMQSGWPSLCIQHNEYSGHYIYRSGKGLKSPVRVPVRIVIDLRDKILHL